MTGYDLNLHEPESFNHKVIWKKFNDRNPLLPVVADKYKVREHVKKVFGEDIAKEILIPLYYVTKDPETIPFTKLPDEYVIKANHNSGPPIFIRRGEDVAREQIILECKTQLRKPYGLLENEWAYWPIDRRIIVQEILLDEDGNIPVDYKFFMFHGECQLIQVDYDRFTKHSRTLYDTDWNVLDASYKYIKGPKTKRPSSLERMLQIARELAKEFDFVRVDLFEVNGQIYFGELTHYPESGRGRFTPKSLDFELGKSWNIEPGYWMQTH